jgi:glycosyltransferase involved in cell wall biosynthesis
VDYPNWEAIIMAGGDDDTYAAACQAVGGDDRFHVLERSDEPKNSAINRGIQSANHDILVLLDADNIVEPGWLQALIPPFQQGFSVSVGHHANKISWVTLYEEMIKIISFEIRRRPVIEGDRSIAIRRCVLEEIGGLPIHTYAREDWDITVSLHKPAIPLLLQKKHYWSLTVQLPQRNIWPTIFVFVERS